jgi:hypothetical protein
VASTPDVTECTACRRQGDARLPIDPWRSLAVHFGMLLGVEDFKTIDAYHRGKMWLHTAWLHRDGVAWGLAPSIDQDRGELRIESGLATDACGRELHLDRAACIDLGKWFAARAAQLLAEAKPADDSIALVRYEGGDVSLNAHVRMRFVGCFDRQVPALTEPCDGAGRTTAYSRTFETVELELIPGLPPARHAAYPRLRMLFGLDPANDKIAAVRAKIAAEPPDKRAALLEVAFRKLAARDAANLLPAVDPDEPSLGLLPAVDPAWFTLAELHTLRFTPAGDGWTFVSREKLKWRHRPTHVATQPLQSLVAASAAAGAAVDTQFLGPRLLRDSVHFDLAVGQLEIKSDEPLDPNTVTLTQVQLTALTATGWQKMTVTGATAVDNKTIMVAFSPMADAQRIRVRIDGSSGTPVVGANQWPLAGANDDPFTPAHAGRDFIHMHTVEAP